MVVSRRAEEEKGIIFLFLLNLFNVSLHRIPRTDNIRHRKKIFLLTCIKSVLYSDGISQHNERQCWAPPESLTKAQILAFYSLPLFYSNRIKYQPCIFSLLCLNELSWHFRLGAWWAGYLSFNFLVQLNNVTFHGPPSSWRPLNSLCKIFVLYVSIYVLQIVYM